MTASRISAFAVHSSLAQMFTIYNSDLEAHLAEFFDQSFSDHEFEQRFVWSSGLISIFPFGASATYWLEVYKSDSYKIEKKANFALSLPFTVSQMDTIQIIGSDDRDAQTVPIARGRYQLIYQDRYLTQSEINKIPDNLGTVDLEPDFWINLGPKSCKLTFIETSTESTAEILKAPEGLIINLPLELRRW
ncbi:MAG: hypothetical protein LH702_30930 [Phormidesmis sp. CAN_BIN44]|nr:hypothetical protein [Phormidesmis sp. CAN_BIN44]